MTDLLTATRDGDHTTAQTITEATLAAVLPEGIVPKAAAHVTMPGQLYLRIEVRDAADTSPEGAVPRIARSTRTLDAATLTVLDPWWEVLPAFQQQGLATTCSAALEAAHAAAGFQRIDIRAQGAGGYAWASLGYRFATEAAARDFLRRARGWTSAQDPTTYAELAAFLDTNPWQTVTPQQVAAIGRTDTDDATWPGRAVLSAVPWLGRKVLTVP